MMLGFGPIANNSHCSLRPCFSSFKVHSNEKRKEKNREKEGEILLVSLHLPLLHNPSEENPAVLGFLDHPELVPRRTPCPEAPPCEL